MMLYLPASIVPLAKLFSGDRMVLVWEKGASSRELSFVPQSPQNFWVSGFSKWHFGHLMDTANPFI
jgi:hypothetical protein